MAHIIECRINMRERIYRVTDESAKEIDGLKQKREKGVWPSSQVLIQREKVPFDAIVIISPEEVWWEHDTRALSSRNKQRCQYCFTVTSFGESCDCQQSKLARAGLMAQPSADTGKRMSPEQVRTGMTRAISIALLAPGVTLKSPVVAGYLRRFNVNAWELPEPTFAEVGRASALHAGKSKTLQEWRALVAAARPAPPAEPAPQDGTALALDTASTVEISSQALDDAPKPVYDPTVIEDERDLHDYDEDVESDAERERMLAEIPF